MFKGFDKKVDEEFAEAKKNVIGWIDSEVQNELAKLKTERQAERLDRINFLRSSQKENILTSGDFEHKKDILGGSIGDATFVKIKNDGNGVFKPHSRHDEDMKMFYINRERAAYLIDQFLGFDLVPPTVIKKIKDEKNKEEIGSLQEFIEDSLVGRECDLKEDVDRDELFKLQVFDAIVCNSDRHSGNFLVKNRRIYGIDHGYSLRDNTVFSPHVEDFVDGRVPNLLTFSIPQNIINLIDDFLESENLKKILQKQLGELIDDDLAKAYILRIEAFRKAVDEDRYLNIEKFGELLEKNEELSSI